MCTSLYLSFLISLDLIHQVRRFSNHGRAKRNTLFFVVFLLPSLKVPADRERARDVERLREQQFNANKQLKCCSKTCVLCVAKELPLTNACLKLDIHLILTEINVIFMQIMWLNQLFINGLYTYGCTWSDVDGAQTDSPK